MGQHRYRWYRTHRHRFHAGVCQRPCLFRHEGGRFAHWLGQHLWHPGPIWHGICHRAIGSSEQTGVFRQVCDQHPGGAARLRQPGRHGCGRPLRDHRRRPAYGANTGCHQRGGGRYRHHSRQRLFHPGGLQPRGRCYANVQLCGGSSQRWCPSLREWRYDHVHGRQSGHFHHQRYWLLPHLCH